MELENETEDSSKYAIAFLVVNDCPGYAIKCIESALAATCNVPILIGFTRENDLVGLPKDPRMQFIKIDDSILRTLSINHENKYLSFSSLTFFQLVQLKWTLLFECLKLDYDFILYSDTDVLWIKNPIPKLQLHFRQHPKLHMQIQNFTEIPNEPRLCMGFVAFRNTNTTREILNYCSQKHHSSLARNPRYGDDNAITDLYIELQQPDSIGLLPQTTFPLGNLINLYARTFSFLGIQSPKPFIFHANFVIGKKDKSTLIWKISKTYSIGHYSILQSIFFTCYAFYISVRTSLSRKLSRLRNSNSS